MLALFFPIEIISYRQDGTVFVSSFQRKSTTAGCSTDIRVLFLDKLKSKEWTPQTLSIRRGNIE